MLGTRAPLSSREHWGAECRCPHNGYKYSFLWPRTSMVYLSPTLVRPFRASPITGANQERQKPEKRKKQRCRTTGVVFAMAQWLSNRRQHQLPAILNLFPIAGQAGAWPGLADICPLSFRGLGVLGLGFRVLPAC